MSGTNLHENQQRSWGWKCMQWGEGWESSTSTPTVSFNVCLSQINWESFLLDFGNLLHPSLDVTPLRQLYSLGKLLHCGSGLWARGFSFQGEDWKRMGFAIYLSSKTEKHISLGSSASRWWPAFLQKDWSGCVTRGGAAGAVLHGINWCWASAPCDCWVLTACEAELNGLSGMVVG